MGCPALANGQTGRVRAPTASSGAAPGTGKPAGAGAPPASSGAAPGTLRSVAAALSFSHPATAGHETGDHPERPERIAAIERELAARGWLGYERRDAPPASREQLVAVHAPEYVDAIEALSAAGGGALDVDTVVSEGSYDAALHAAGGAAAMATALLAGEARVAFAAVRPPGHHARRDTTSGYCLFNNVAVAARHALDALG